MTALHSRLGQLGDNRALLGHFSHLHISHFQQLKQRANLMIKSSISRGFVYPIAHHTSEISNSDRDMIPTSRGMLAKMASPLLTQMGITNITSQPVDFFDNACGTGVLTQELQSMLTNEIIQKSSFLCADKAQNMVDMVKKRVTDEGWTNTKVTTLGSMVLFLTCKGFGDAC